jgi:hypothetical protein
MKMRDRLLIRLCLVAAFVFLAASTQAGGISVDAGITPAEDRWILRTQVRHMQRRNDPTEMGREMTRYVFPIVLAYGLRSNVTLMMRQTALRQEMSMMGNNEEKTGLGDLFVLVKYKAYRLNTASYTFALAPTLGLELPTGSDAFTSETWDLNTGMYLSWRSGPWAADMNVAYAWRGFADENKNDVDPGDQLSLDCAFAHQFSIGEKASTSLAPVLEFSYKKTQADRLQGQDISNTGESVLQISPGVKVTVSSTIIEALIQVPAWQDQEGLQLEQGIVVLIGTRVMF